MIFVWLTLIFFERQLHNIYPDSLIANRSGNDCTVAAYLDVLVRVGQNGFSTSVYHKVDDFSFPVDFYTFPGSNHLKWVAMSFHLSYLDLQ